MIQRYGYLLYQVNHLNSFLQNHGLCQKIFSTPHFLCFSIRRPGESIWVYIGRGGEYQGLWISKTAPPSNARIQDTFLSLIRKHLITPWHLLKLDQLDRIILIKTSYFGKFQSFLYFWNGNDSYFLQHFYNELTNSWVIHKSWNTKLKIEIENELTETELFEIFNEVGRKNLPDKILPEESSVASVLSHQMERYLVKYTTTNDNSDKFEHSKKHLRKLTNIKKDLEKLSHYNTLKEYLDTNPEAIPDELVFGSLKIKFPLMMNLEQRRNFAFNKLKSWKKNYLFMQDRLTNEQATPTTLQPQKVEKIIKPIWRSIDQKKSQASDAAATTQKNNFTNCSFHRIDTFHATIAIGKSATANDQLRNSWSKKTDYWFHLLDMTSAHIFVRPMDDFILSQDFFNFIGSLLLSQSNSTATSANMVYCLAKDLRPVKGQAGSVKYKNEKKVLFFFTPTYSQHLT